MKNSFRLGAVAVVVGGIAFAGCASATEDGSATTGAASEAKVAEVGALHTRGLVTPFGSCPSTVADTIQQQRNAQGVLGYIVGGNAPAVPTSTNGTCQSLAGIATYWRNKFLAGPKKGALAQSGDFRSATLAPRTTVCSRVVQPVVLDVYVNDGEHAWGSLLQAMADCYGTGVGPFAQIMSTWDECTDPSCTQFHSTLTIDPEVAILSAPLGGTGAAASAYMANDGTPVTAYDMPCATCTPIYRPTVPIGSVCASVASPAGSLLSAYATPVYNSAGALMSGYRRCVGAGGNIMAP